MNINEKREKNRIKNQLWRKNNPDKYRKSASNYRKNHPNKILEYKLQTRYKITPQEYNLLLNKQEGKCAICKNYETAIHNFTKKNQKLAVDHCHTTNVVRGLLCMECNRGIGLFHDDISRLTNAIKYLTKI